MLLVKVWEVAEGIEDERAEEPTLSSSSGNSYFIFQIILFFSEDIVLLR